VENASVTGKQTWLMGEDLLVNGEYITLSATITTACGSVMVNAGQVEVGITEGS
jgi:hypothetical protein